MIAVSARDCKQTESVWHLAKDAVELGAASHEGLKQGRIKMAGGGLGHELDRSGVRQRRFVDATRTQRIVHVANGHDTGGQRNGATRQPVGVSGAVEALVVMPGDVDGHVAKKPTRCRGAWPPRTKSRRRSWCAPASKRARPR